MPRTKVRKTWPTTNRNLIKSVWRTSQNTKHQHTKNTPRPHQRVKTSSSSAHFCFFAGGGGTRGTSTQTTKHHTLSNLMGFTFKPNRSNHLMQHTARKYIARNKRRGPAREHKKKKVPNPHRAPIKHRTHHEKSTLGKRHPGTTKGQRSRHLQCIKNRINKHKTTNNKQQTTINKQAATTNNKQQQH